MARNSEARLFKDKERLLKQKPGLGESYSRFLKDWNKYRSITKPDEKTRQSQKSAVFGASF